MTQDILSRMGAAASSLEPAEIKRMIDNLRDNVDSAIKHFNDWQAGFDSLSPGEPSGITFPDNFAPLNQLGDYGYCLFNGTCS